jgi:nicotinamidase-related amidase
MAKKGEPILEPRAEAGAALLVIDVQQGLFRKSTPVYQADKLLENINSLVASAHMSGIPVVYIQHADQKSLVTGSDDWQLHPQLQPLESDCLVHKRHGNAFLETGLDEELRSRQVGTVVVTGLVTHGCVRATCTGAHELGYRVILVNDGHSSYSRNAAELVEEWNQKLGAGFAELKPAGEIDFSTLEKG